MKKKILIVLLVCILLIAVILSLVGFKNVDSNDSKSETEQNYDNDQSTNTDASSKSSDSSEITLEDIMNAPESPAEDFSGSDNGEGGYSITGYNGTDEIVVIPDEIDGLPVTKIEKYAFSNNRTETVRAIRLSDSVISLEDGGVFANNDILEIFVTGSGLEIIGNYSFLNCTSLKTVVLNEGLVEIGDSAFANCSSLSEITIPSTVETMGTMCIYNTPEDFVLYGVAGSVAESYAQQRGLTFVEN